MHLLTPVCAGLTADMLASGTAAEPYSNRCFNVSCAVYFILGGLMCLPGCNGLNVYAACCQRR